MQNTAPSQNPNPKGAPNFTLRKPHRCCAFCAFCIDMHSSNDGLKYEN